MRRVNAAQMYFFGEDYFSELARELGPALQLFVAVIGDKTGRGRLVHNLRRHCAVPT